MMEVVVAVALQRYNHWLLQPRLHPPATQLRTQKTHETSKDMPNDWINSWGAALLTKGWLNPKTEDPSYGAITPAAT